MRTKNCPNCKTKLNYDARYCDNCGDFFASSDDNLEKKHLQRFEEPSMRDYEDTHKTTVQLEQETKQDRFQQIEQVSDAALNDMLFSYINLKQLNTIKTLLGFVIIISVIVSFTAPEIPFFSFIIPIVLTGAFHRKKELQEQASTHYQNSNYSKAYNKLQELYKMDKSSKVIKQIILVSYYRMQKEKEAKRLISILNNRPHIKDQNIIKVASLLGVKYEPKLNVNYQTSFNK
jgi:hypothetical protein